MKLYSNQKLDEAAEKVYETINWDDQDLAKNIILSLKDKV